MRESKAYLLRTHTKPDGKLDLFGLLAWLTLKIFAVAGIVFLVLEAFNRNLDPGTWLVVFIFYVVITFTGLMLLVHRDEQIGIKR